MLVAMALVLNPPLDRGRHRGIEITSAREVKMRGEREREREGHFSQLWLGHISPGGGDRTVVANLDVGLICATKGSSPFC